MLALVGFVMILSIIVILLKGKMSPIVALILIPFIAGLLTGFSVDELSGFVKAGIATVSNNSFLFIFSIIFFSVMSDVGVFDGIVNLIVKRAGNNVVAITVATGIIGIIAHLDGATATTVLITIPTMYPIYKKMNIRPYVLLLLTALAMGVMNLLPWGGPVARAASVIGMDANELWLTLIPIQIFGVIATLVVAVLLGRIEQKRGAGISDEEFARLQKEEEAAPMDEEEAKLKRPKLLLFNTLLTFGVIATLMFVTTMPAYLIFMLGLSIAMVVNFPSLKDQDGRIKAHAAAALSISATILAAGVMVGIMEGTGMLEAMAMSFLSIIPDFLGSYVHLIFGVLALPMGMMIGTDAYFFGVMPLVIEVGSQFGVAGLNTAITMLIGKNLSLMISPLVPATYLALGLVDIDIKDHIRFSFKWLFIVSLAMLAGAILIGLVKI